MDIHLHIQHYFCKNGYSSHIPMHALAFVCHHTTGRRPTVSAGFWSGGAWMPCATQACGYHTHTHRGGRCGRPKKLQAGSTGRRTHTHTHTHKEGWLTGVITSETTQERPRNTHNTPRWGQRKRGTPGLTRPSLRENCGATAIETVHSMTCGPAGTSDG